MIGVETFTEPPPVLSPPSTPKKNHPLPKGFTAAAQQFTDHIKHGTTQEISIERLKFEIPLDSPTPRHSWPVS